MFVIDGKQLSYNIIPKYSSVVYTVYSVYHHLSQLHVIKFRCIFRWPCTYKYIYVVVLENGWCPEAEITTSYNANMQFCNYALICTHSRYSDVHTVYNISKEIYRYSKSFGITNAQETFLRRDHLTTLKRLKNWNLRKSKFKTGKSRRNYVDEQSLYFERKYYLYSYRMRYSLSALFIAIHIANSSLRVPKFTVRSFTCDKCFVALIG